MMRRFEKLDLETRGRIQGHCITTIDPDNSTKCHQLLVYLPLGLSIMSGHFDTSVTKFLIFHAMGLFIFYKMTRYN